MCRKIWCDGESLKKIWFLRWTKQGLTHPEFVTCNSTGTIDISLTCRLLTLELRSLEWQSTATNQWGLTSSVRSGESRGHSCVIMKALAVALRYWRSDTTVSFSSDGWISLYIRTHLWIRGKIWLPESNVVNLELVRNKERGELAYDRGQHKFSMWFFFFLALH